MSFTCQEAIPYELAAMGAQTRKHLESWCDEQATDYTSSVFDRAISKLIEEHVIGSLVVGGVIYFDLVDNI